MKHEHTTRSLRICFNSEDDVLATIHLGDRDFIPRQRDLFRWDFMDHVKHDRREELAGKTFVVKNVILEYVLKGEWSGEMFRATVILEDPLTYF